MLTGNQSTRPMLRSEEGIFCIPTHKHWERTLGSRIVLQKLYGKYRDYYGQVSSNLIAMEPNMLGNPLIISFVFTPHDDANDDRIRQRAWEDFTNFIHETPEAINTVILGDLHTNIHAIKKEKRDIPDHTFMEEERIF